MRRVLEHGVRENHGINGLSNGEGTDRVLIRNRESFDQHALTVDSEPHETIGRTLRVGHREPWLGNNVSIRDGASKASDSIHRCLGDKGSIKVARANAVVVGYRASTGIHMDVATQHHSDIVLEEKSIPAISLELCTKDTIFVGISDGAVDGAMLADDDVRSDTTVNFAEVGGDPVPLVSTVGHVKLSIDLNPVNRSDVCSDLVNRVIE